MTGLSAHVTNPALTSAARCDTARPASPATPRRHAWRTLLGRQPIVTAAADTVGFEFLYRSPTRRPVRVDTWSAEHQDRASGKVLAQVFGTGAHHVAGDHLAFVNITRAYLVGDLPLPPHPARLVLEVVESVPLDPAVVAGVRRLRGQGYRIALDDFTGSPAQIALLPFADYVKVDYRDLETRGDALVDLAGSSGAKLIAERVEDEACRLRCAAVGFDLFQGHLFAAASVLDLTDCVPSPRAG
ncbi:EAL and HDOD domain-containing protein [Cellulomonas timonensis]|uniref:EAL and HDOD domain-containing protein n=1 Tax=Cellulomonas timonensis TaxID=1689271 RepID=UPI0009EE6593|nr:EAL domain-containing protein [Cellulomonas timonensis]